MITLHTIGDSHANYWEGWDKIQIPGLKIQMHGIASRLMYSWSNNQENIPVKGGPNVWVCFCFGEIDVRAHVHKYVDDWQGNIDSLVEKYIANIIRNTASGQYKVFIYNVIPHLDLNPRLPGVPRVGTAEDVKKYTLYINEKLRERCQENGFHFIDTYDNYCNDKGFLDEKYSDMICHIGNPIHNENWLRDFCSNL